MKVARSAFLYMAPKTPEDAAGFAQCGACVLFLGDEARRCAIHGSEVGIDAGDSCGLFIPGTPDEDQPVGALVTPEESGLVRQSVQCRRCEFAKAMATRCGLYAKLNRLGEFALDDEIEPAACCNAWTPRQAGRAEMRYGGHGERRHG